MPKRDPKEPPFESEELEPVKLLNRGAWGFVWRYRQFSRATGAVRHARTAIGYAAVKCVEVSEYTRLTLQHAFGEARAQRRGAGNPHVVALYDVVVAEDNLIALVMEEVEGGRTLADEIDEAYRANRQFPADLIAQWAKEIAIGLQAFHAPARRDGERVAHRDIAPDNVLLTPDRVVKLADMGIATVVGESGLGPSDPAPALGRTMRMAPEQYYGDGEWGIAVDYWALGLILFELATHTPLEHFCREKVPTMTPSPEYSRAIGDAVRRQARQHPWMHPELRDLIAELLTDDPRIRADFARVKEAQARLAAGHAQHTGSGETSLDRGRSSVGGSVDRPTKGRGSTDRPSWISDEELAGLQAALGGAQTIDASHQGAFERLVGARRARRHMTGGE